VNGRYYQNYIYPAMPQEMKRSFIMGMVIKTAAEIIAIANPRLRTAIIGRVLIMRI
jgi:hypothetical protein